MEGLYTIHFNPLWAVPSFIAGALNLFVAALPNTPVTAGILGVMFLVLGVLFLVMPMLVVSDVGVQVKNLFGMTLKIYPLESLADLEIQGSKLLIQREDEGPQKVRGVWKWFAKPADWDALNRAVAAAKSADS